MKKLISTSKLSFWHALGLLDSAAHSPILSSIVADIVNSILTDILFAQGTSGMYFFGGRGRMLKSSPMSYDGELAERLWRKSCDLFVELKLAYDKKTANLAYQLQRC